MSSILDRKRPSATKGVGWLAPHRDTFLTQLGRLGYAAKTIRHYGLRGRLPTHRKGAGKGMEVRAKTTKARATVPPNIPIAMRTAMRYTIP